jgi:hypothetical protein
MTKLEISKDLALPLRVVTEKLAWLGTTGSGKTYGASKLAELMWDAHAQFVVLDPVGVWYGLRLEKNGKSPSDITIPIFGGLHGDVPLEPTAGALMADLVVDRGISVILDVSQFESDAQKARFGADFADRFFFRKKGAPSAVHVFIEECQEFIPQNPQKGEERMLHAFTRMQKLGRNFGIGTSAISQRPQEVNKKALNMAQTLFVFRCTGPQERKAIAGWVEEKGLDQNIAGDLPKLRTGDCHAWSPEFLGVSEVIRITEKRTFNASATPEVGAAARKRELAPIDLERIRTDMAATIEKAKAENPTELKRKIAELEKQLKAKQPMAAAAADQKSIDRAVATAIREKAKEYDATIRELTSRLDRIGKLYARAFKVHEEVAGELQLASATKLPEIPAMPHLAMAPPPRREMPIVTRAAAPQRVIPSGGNGKSTDGSFGIDGGEQRILDALAELEAIGVRQPTRVQVAILSNYATLSGGTGASNVGRLSEKGLVSIPSPGVLELTDEGRHRANHSGAPTSRSELHERLLRRLDDGERRIMEHLINIWPDEAKRADVAAATNYATLSGGTGASNVGKLASLGLVKIPRPGLLRASDLLFPEQLA